ncbi:MAG: response regulator transcription factor [bacterium]
MNTKKIVVLIAHSKIGDKIEGAFIRANFDVFRTEDSYQAMSFLKKENPHAMVVDWDLVNGTTKEIARIIRDNCRKTALVLLSKSRKAEERIQALEEGADDFFVQPPEVEELVAKVKALVRRIDLVDHAPRALMIKDISINLDTHEVRKDGKLIDMTYTQFKLLYLLASHRDYVFSRDEILDKVWGEKTYVTNRTVDVHVKRLREKLGENRQPSKYIQTIHGLGYRFV